MRVTTSKRQVQSFTDALNNENACRNEKLWTLLVADIVADERHQAAAIELLCGESRIPLDDFAVWLEGQPMSPRKGEGNSEIDLAFGNVGRRGQTGIGIEPNKAEGWVCFCEAKVLSDCSTTVANDLTRNQLARVIENLMTFQRAGVMPAALAFSLLTPRFFRDEGVHSRLYDYKYREYVRRADSILEDIQRSRIPPRSERGWEYPSLAPRLEVLRIHWATYEDVFALDDELAGIDVVQVAMSGVLPDVVAGRMGEAAARLEATTD